MTNENFSVRQTPCLLMEDGILKNELRVTVTGRNEKKVTLTLDGAAVWCGEVIDGKEFVVNIPAVTEKREGEFALSSGEKITVPLRPQRDWEVHIVQFSHHDPGYTDIPSHVLWESAEQLREALDHLDARADWPEEAKPRIVIEQAYSLYQFLRRSHPDDVARMIHHIKEGNVEVTAFWANLISELLSSEECLRAMYPSKAIEDLTGVPVVSAEHNDITGFTWGYATALCRAGVKYFLPNLPLYYSWGYEGYESFWDEEAVFGRKGPGAFWWESAEGDRIFLWCNNNGCVEETEPDLPSLLPELENLEATDWPHRVFRLQVRGEYKDNSKFITGYSDTVRAWNEKYVSPRLICSTEKMFCESFLRHLTVELPVLKGGVDGQDYPIASTSQMQPSSFARQDHALFRTAEILSSLTPETKDLWLKRAMEDMLMADEHAYGAGNPAHAKQLTSWWEHGVYASRAYYYAEKTMEEAAHTLCGKIAYKDDVPHITVFNTTANPDPAFVTVKMNDLGNAYLDGKFRLVEVSTGKEISYRLKKLDWDNMAFMASERAGVGAGTKRMGLFDPPTSTGYEMRFVAPGIPAYGYASYALLPVEEASVPATCPLCDAIENEFYRISFTSDGITDLIDRSTGASLLDANAPHTLGQFLIRYANDTPVPANLTSVSAEKIGGESILTLQYEGEGVDMVRMEITLVDGVDNVGLTLRVRKNPKPLQSLYVAFPFAGSGIRYQSVLHETEPAADLLPGSQSDVIAVQNWVQTKDTDILWNSANAPVVSLSHLWEGYISPAHRCIMTPPGHPPLKPEQYDTGCIYSILTCNNFGTNFYTSQVSDATYRYTFAARHDRNAYEWGAKAAELSTYCVSKGKGEGDLPEMGTFLTVPGLHILTLKRAENANGLILRVQNTTDGEISAPVTLWGKAVQSLTECDALERDLHLLQNNTVTVSAGKLATYRIL